MGTFTPLMNLQVYVVYDRDIACHLLSFQVEHKLIVSQNMVLYTSWCNPLYIYLVSLDKYHNLITWKTKWFLYWVSKYNSHKPDVGI